MVKDLYRLTKPGIVYGNAITAAAGFFLGIKGAILPGQLFLSVAGISLIVAAGCVFNNYIDRDIDSKMERTKKRTLPRGRISESVALTFGTTLLIMGSILLFVVSVTALLVTLLGFLVYVVAYSLFSKRNTLHSTIIGAVSGAVPPVAGYAASTLTLDVGAVIIFLILFSWQVPHTLAIMIRRISDFKAAEIPAIPISLGYTVAKIQMICYVFLFLLANISLSLAGYAGIAYAIVMTSLGVVWLVLSIYGLWLEELEHWAKRVFLFSLILLLAFCLSSVGNVFLP